MYGMTDKTGFLATTCISPSVTYRLYVPSLPCTHSDGLLELVNSTHHFPICLIHFRQRKKSCFQTLPLNYRTMLKIWYNYNSMSQKADLYNPLHSKVLFTTKLAVNGNTSLLGPTLTPYSPRSITQRLIPSSQ